MAQLDTVRDRLRPATLPAERVVACLGLISDTHKPDRYGAFPAALFDVLRGVDLVLHAGDVGQLAVLDELSVAAPVVAVHGNDERDAETPRELPYQQVVSVAGQRILLTHGHYPDLQQEMDSRRDDRWEPKLDRRAAFGHSAGARMVVYGHTHVPTNVLHQGVWLINPGALASGGLHTRQRHQTVALLYLRDDGTPFTVHVDLAQPDRPFQAHVDWNAGFRAAHQRCEASILAPDLVASYERLRTEAAALDQASRDAVRGAIRTVALRCWAGEQPWITRHDLRVAIQEAAGVPEPVREKLAALFNESRGGAL